jgi:hypothetical protein
MTPFAGANEIGHSAPPRLPACDARRVADRYADAVRARRAELRAERGALTGSHRPELRGELALARLAVTTAVTSGARALAREAHERVDTGDRRARRELPAQVDAAIEQLSGEIATMLERAVGPVLRRAAGARGVATAPGWPAVPAAQPPELPGWPRRRPLFARLLDGTAAGLAAWRLLLVPVAAIPVLGLPIVAGPALLPLAVGLVAAGVVAAVRARLVAADRALLHRGVDESVTSARIAVEGDVTRRLMELEHAAGMELDRAVDARRAVVEDELRTLTEGVARA